MVGDTVLNVEFEMFHFTDNKENLQKSAADQSNWGSN